MNRLIILISVLTFSYSALAQELNCNFTINHDRIQGTNKQVFTTLQESVQDFLNNTIWTNHVFEANERIVCNMVLEIMEIGAGDEYKAKLQVQARRPVYGTSYNTVLLNYIDNEADFKYTEFDPIEFSTTSYTSNLSSLLAYYVYFIIGLDYDSFSRKGGTAFFQICENVVQQAQSSGYMGWMASDSRQRKNRYWFIENMLDSDYEPLRGFNYDYHRLGLDVMGDESVGIGRDKIYNAIEDLKTFYDNKPDPFVGLLQVYTDSKSDEIVNIFKEAPEANKKKVYAIMNKIDPAGGQKYDELK